jgi:hypothetical protein
VDECAWVSWKSSFQTKPTEALLELDGDFDAEIL